ncbi:L-rhamnose mutarotase [Actinoplanes sp. CA-030573]|uniref:L-rhamnose mutarotase n=1 Tax=Actinoplanes sp. CA-030573 TaxID=3239898 RepID=UPI003D8A9044
MPRYCFNLQVRPERLAEYVERHQAVWPEMQDALRATGWRNYSLFLRSDGLPAPPRPTASRCSLRYFTSTRKDVTNHG